MKKSAAHAALTVLSVLAMAVLVGAREDAAGDTVAAVQKPQYRLHADIDFDLLTFQGEGRITVPVGGNDALKDAVFFVYANAGGVGGDDERRRNISVDAVSMNGVAVPFTLRSAVLRVTFPQPQTRNVALDIRWHGVVPRSPPGSGGLADMMGGGGDLGSMFGGAPQEKPKNIDYGLYTYGNGMLSLGAFWYPTLAVRQNGRWVDEAPEGLGDVAYTVMSDYDVSFQVSQPVVVAAAGARVANAQGNAANWTSWRFSAKNVRDFAVLMSEDYVTKSKSVNVGGKPVTLTAYLIKKHIDKTDKALDIAEHALQTYAKVFGPYGYSTFKVVEGPMRSGAGGMEYSGMTAIASSLFEDLNKQLNDLAGSLGVGGMNPADLEKIIGDDDGAGTGPAAAPNAQEGAGDNPAADMLNGILGQQKGVFDSLLEATIAHEVAHQWWAIGVGSDSQRAPWLDESLTNYSSMLYFEDRYGRATAEKMIDLHLKTGYSTGRMLGLADAPVNARTSAFASNMQYGAIVYGKGALFYDALRKLMGDTAFFAALRNYYARFDNHLATSASLLGSFRAQEPAKTGQIDALYRRWIMEQHGDDDITGGKPAGIEDLLGGLFGGGMGDE